MSRGHLEVRIDHSEGRRTVGAGCASVEGATLGGLIFGRLARRPPFCPNESSLTPRVMPGSVWKIVDNPNVGSLS